MKELVLDLNAIPRAARIVVEEARRVFRHKRKPGPHTWEDLDLADPPDEPSCLHSLPYDLNAADPVIPALPEGDHKDARGNQWINRPGDKPKPPPNRGTR